MQTTNNPEIRQELDRIEQLRLQSISKGKKLDRLNALFIIFIVIGGILGIVRFFGYGDCTFSILPIMVGIGGLIGILLLKQKHYNTFRNHFRRYVTETIIKGLGKDYTYSPNNYVHPQYYIDTLVINENPDYMSFHGSELITKQDGDISVLCSKLAAKDTRPRSKNDSSNVIYHEGLFIVFELNHQFKGHTYISIRSGAGFFTLPTFIENIADSFWSIRGFKDFDGSLPEFHQLFKVYTTDPEEAQQLITPEFQQFIIDVYKSNKSWLKSAFNKNLFVLGMETYTIKFSPNEKQSIHNSIVVEEYIKKVNEIFHFIERAKPFIIGKK